MLALLSGPVSVRGQRLDTVQVSIEGHRMQLLVAGALDDGLMRARGGRVVRLWRSTPENNMRALPVEGARRCRR